MLCMMIATVIQEEKLCIKNTCVHLSKLGKKPKNTKNQREINKKMFKTMQYETMKTITEMK